MYLSLIEALYTLNSPPVVSFNLGDTTRPGFGGGGGGGGAGSRAYGV